MRLAGSGGSGSSSSMKNHVTSKGVGDRVAIAQLEARFPTFPSCSIDKVLPPKLRVPS